MKKKSSMSSILTIVFVALAGLLLTLLIAFIVGSSDANLFDLSELNLSNFIPVILIGGFITCIAVGIVTLLVSKNIFLKIKDYFLEDNKNGGNKE